ncbi:hypothetical protein ST201phi2-1p023 [Pseudomonas phage 201phi2-1]|uniref:Uncharacterized protein n=1 Tax=Pseudomonas phage 201phi2-1 TaxID=198110 RepID=B3FJZ9_BP201|nr:hypothetical protein ST201phi2-1p023 [Pseudomonas phage 201phi2-1]ABY62857.1 hypothetical protein 201phi2-1p023 [Pseudomonas phage 201phi2-1]
MLGHDIPWMKLVQALRITLAGGCSTPTTRARYTARFRIQMPRILTEEELTFLETKLSLLPCQCDTEIVSNGRVMNLLVYREYQGG